MSSTTVLLEVQDLCCIRDDRVLLQHLNVRLAAHQSLHIEGVNGSGKSSLLRILCGLLPAQQGTVCWQGNDIQRDRITYQQALLFIGHAHGLKATLSARQNLLFYAALRGAQHSQQALNHALAQVGLRGFEDSPVRSLSAGQKRRVALARLWLNDDAKLWLLDEPLTALDQAGIANLQQRLSEHTQAGGVLVFTSHQRLDLPNLQTLGLGQAPSQVAA